MAYQGPRYTRVAIMLHWMIAVAIILQLFSGWWMTDALHNPDMRGLAFKIYQWHKALGLSVLVLSLVRLGWRLLHPVPPLPAHMKPWERLAAHASHWLFYVFMITVPMLGWAMVSASPLGLPTLYFGFFEWPHIPWLEQVEDKKAVSGWFEESHALAAYSLLALLCVHIAAALKHYLIDRDDVLSRMLPFISPRRS